MSLLTAFVLDSDQARRDDIRMRLSHCGVQPISFQDQWTCLENIHHIRPTFAVLRPDNRQAAMRFVHMARAIQSTLPLIVISDQADIREFVCKNWFLDLMSLAYPTDNHELQAAVSVAAQRGGSADAGRPILIAGSAESQVRIQRLPLFAHAPEPVLIQGEPGVGKRLMAKAIHSAVTGESPDLEWCDARDISAQWIRSMRERTQAQTGAAGRTCCCVIENIDALSIELQSQLLLIMDSIGANGRVKGGTPSIRFLTLAATDLADLSRSGRFRQDLYHRLSVLKLTVPPLRSRKDDVPALTDYFAAKTSIRVRGIIAPMPDTVRSVFRRYHWPGNVAELKATIGWMTVAQANARAANLPDRRDSCSAEKVPPSAGMAFDVGVDVRRFLKDNRGCSLREARQRCTMQVESRMLKSALFQTNGNCKKAADILQISYKSMLNKVKAYHLS